jgi:hypothetical protein
MTLSLQPPRKARKSRTAAAEGGAAIQRRVKMARKRKAKVQTKTRRKRRKSKED